MNIFSACLTQFAACEACNSCRCADSTDPAWQILPCMRVLLAPNERIHSAGDPVERVAFVQRGALRLVTQRSRGRRNVVGFKYAGECLVPPVGRRHAFDAEAVDVTELRVLPLDRFEAALGNDGGALARLHGMLHAELVATYDRMAVLGHRDSRAALAAFLIEAASRLAPCSDGGWFHLLVQRADIADHLGLRPETVSRVFSGFLAQSLIERAPGRRLRLRDKPRLSLIVAGRA